MALNVRLHNTAELRSEDDILLFRELTEHVLWLRRRRRVAFLKYLLCLSAERRLPRSVACLTCERKDNLCKSNGTQRRRLRRKPSSPHVHSSKSGMLLVPAKVNSGADFVPGDAVSPRTLLSIPFAGLHFVSQAHIQRDYTSMLKNIIEHNLLQTA